MAPKGKEGAKQLIYSLKKGTSVGLVIDQKIVHNVLATVPVVVKACVVKVVCECYVKVG